MTVHTTHFEEDDHCPNCGETLNAATSPEGFSPSPGDYSICANCYSFLQFDDNLKHQVLTEEEVLKMPTNAYLQLTVIRFQLEMERGV